MSATIAKSARTARATKGGKAKRPLPHRRGSTRQKEDRVFALLTLTLAATEDLLTAHRAAEGGCDCSVWHDAVGLRWNLEMAVSVVETQLPSSCIYPDQSLLEEYDRTARLPAEPRGWKQENTAEENRLLRLLTWLNAAIEGLQADGASRLSDLEGIGLSAPFLHGGSPRVSAARPIVPLPGGLFPFHPPTRGRDPGKTLAGRTKKPPAAGACSAARKRAADTIRLGMYRHPTPPALKRKSPR